MNDALNEEEDRQGTVEMGEMESMYLARTIRNHDEVRTEILEKSNGMDGDLEGKWRIIDDESMFKSTIYIDWDRRKSVNLDDVVFKGFVDERDGNKFEAKCSYRDGEDVGGILSVKVERDREEIGRKKSSGLCISKFRAIGKYKYTYAVDRDIIRKDILDRGMFTVVCNREMVNNSNDKLNESSEEGENSSDPVVLDNDDGHIDDEGSREGYQAKDEGKGESGNALCGKTGTNLHRAKGVKTGTRTRKRSKRKTVKKRRQPKSNKANFKLNDFVPLKRNLRDYRLRGEEEWLEEALRVSSILLDYLQDEWIEVPHLRCVHVKENGTRLVFVCTARMRRTITEDQVEEVATVGVMMQELNRDVVCVNCIHEKKRSSDDGLCMKEVISCSCNVIRRNGIICESQCWHVKSLHINEFVLKKIRYKLAEAFSMPDVDGEENETFGEWIEVTSGKVSVGEEEEDNLICTQMDQLDTKSLTRRGGNIARRWSCWNVYDVPDATFVCCIRRALGTGISVTRMKCTQCRLGSERKCRHEAACSKVLADAGAVQLNENGEMQELTGPNDVLGEVSGNDNSDSEYSDLGVELRGNVVPAVEGIGGRPDNAGKKRKRKCIRQPASYLSCDKRRALYMCRSERRLAEQLTDLIEEWDRAKGGLTFVDPDGWVCRGKVYNDVAEVESCPAIKDNRDELILRKVTVFTLNHGALSVVLTDWICKECEYENRYNGELHGIYPTAKFRAFTVELMYYWMHLSMSHGLSFRSVFEITGNLQNSCSYRRKFSVGRLDVLAPEFKRDRRLANAAMRFFCLHIDLSDSSEVVSKLFSCSKCEVQLSNEDVEQLGLRKEVVKHMKRYTSVVMDGKVIGALREFPIDTSNVHRLIGTTALPSKVMSNRETRSALKTLTRGLRRMIRAVEYGRGAEVKHNISEKNGFVYFRFGSLSEMSGVTKSNYDRIMKVGRWFCNRGSCLCVGSKWTTELGHEDCESEREALLSTAGCAAASKALAQVFGIGGDGEDGEEVETRGFCTLESQHPAMETPSPVGVIAERDVEKSSDEDSSEDGDSPIIIAGVDTKNQWMHFKVKDWKRCTVVMETLLENIQLCLGEPLCLGFFPFYPECAATGGHQEKVAQKRFTSGRNDLMWNDWSEEYLGLLVSNGGEGMHNFLRDVHTRREVIDMLSAEAVRAHRSVSSSLHSFSTCVHGGLTESSFPCAQCAKTLEDEGKVMKRQNTILSLFIAEVIRVGTAGPVLSRTACGIVHDVLDAKLHLFQEYRRQAATKMDPSVAKYWQQFGHLGNKDVVPHVDENTPHRKDHSVFIFPGRQYVREPMVAVGKEKSDCKKKYFSSRKDMSSFISLQCACQHPKIIGFSLIKEVESISMAISTVLSHLNLPPRTLWYENACNLFDYAILRTPWLLRSCFPVVDRFHFHGHTCSNHFNPDRYSTLVKDRSVAAEVLNAVLDRSARYIRYLKSRNIKPYIRILFALHNFSSMVKDNLNRKELPSLDLGVIYNDLFPCKCVSCIVKREEDEWEDCTFRSVSFTKISKAK